MYRRSFIQKTKWILVLTALMVSSIGNSNSGVDRENKSLAPEVPPTPEQALERFTTNLTRNAIMNPDASPFMGRVADKIRVITILSQKGTQVLYLVGPAGSGKTALVEAVAGELKGVELLQLDMTALQSGSPFKNEFETRLKALMTKLIASKGQYILFIDEFHSMMKVEGMADILKPAMARGEISVVAATTLDEYREFVEPDKAMTSRGQRHDVTEMTKNEALEMLRSRKSALGQKYGLVILDSTLKQAVDLAARFYSADPLSRRALQIVDETMSRIATQLKYGTHTQRYLEDKLKTLENERKSLEMDLPFLKDAENEAAQKRIAALKIEETNSRENIEIEKRGGTPSGIALDLARKEMYLKEQELKELKSGPTASDRKVAQRIYLLEAEVNKIRSETLPKLRAAWEKEAQERGKDKPVGMDEVRLTVSADRRIPMDGIGSTAEERVARFSNLWQKNIYGQDQIRISLERKLLAREKGLEPNLDKPMSVMFNGPTGTGKTEAAKMLAEGLLFDSTAFIRIDMGQHQTAAASWTLFGAAKGHVNQAEGGILTEAVRQRPFAVLLLDEYEKAHTDLDKTLLKVLDEGRIVDNSGRPVDFRNVIIVLTTNITAEWMFDRAILDIREIEQKYGFREGLLANLTMEDVDREVSNRLLHGRFTKEFLARVDLKLNYNPINEALALELSRKEFKRQAEALEERHGVKLKVTEGAIAALAQRVMNSPEGGREAANSRRNFITDYVLVDAFDKKNNVQRGQELIIDFDMNTNRNGGTFKVIRAGQTLSSVKMLMPVRLSQSSGGGAGLPPGSREVDRSEMMRMMERAQGSQEAARGQNAGIVDSKGQPIGSTPTEAGRARGK